MNKNLFFLYILFILTSNIFATTTKNEKTWCPVCANNIKEHNQTSYMSQLANGTKREYCSLKCFANDYQEYGLALNKTKVKDYSSKKYINALDAYYLINSSIRGINSAKSKLAFKSKSIAKKYQDLYHGKIVTFKEALNLSIKNQKINNNRLKKIYSKKTYIMGKKIFKKNCQNNIDFEDYLEINELKADLYNNLCKPLTKKRLHMVTLYLWDIKRNGIINLESQTIRVDVDEKCPVCGMFTYKYPRWVAQIFYKHNNIEHHHSFDGVKDMMKFYFNPNAWGNYTNFNIKNISKILVTDYYAQKAIDATKAYYVIRSDIYGPMGHELIPFENKSDAINFKKDHFGTTILKFDQIKEKEVYKLDQ